MDAGLKPGMSATAEVVVKQAEGVNVPTSAITASTVTVVRGGKHVRQRVMTGLAGNSTTIILSGLKAGETIVLPSTSTTGTSSRSSTSGRLGGRRVRRPAVPAAGAFFRGRTDDARSRALRREPRTRGRAGSRSSRAPRAGTARADGRPRPPVIEVHEVSQGLRARPDPGARAPRRVRCGSRRATSSRSWARSGSGKSTLMNILGCLDIPSSGRYLIDGVDVGHMDEDDLADLRNRKIGFVFQSFNLVPRTSALINVELPLAYAGLRGAERRERAERALASVGMAKRMHHQPSELSGGQQQRAAVARAIVTNPSLILADEPTGNLDSHATEDVLRIFSSLNAEGRTVVLITHEPDVAQQTKRIIRLSDGEIVEDRRLAGCTTRRRRRTQHEVRPPAAREHGPGATMIGAETLRIAWNGISANKLRSGLTILGMTIGVASVIVLIAVGNGSSKAVASTDPEPRHQRAGRPGKRRLPRRRPRGGRPPPSR